jgi:hypothetical protein
MPPELGGQIISGSSLSERDLYARMIHYIQNLRDCYRGMSLSRGDERWLVPARMMEQLEDSTKRLMVAKQRPFLITPYKRN